MAWSLRLGRALLLVLVAGCSAAAPAHPAQPAAAEQTAATASAAPTPIAPLNGAPAPTAPAPNPTVPTTAATQDAAAGADTQELGAAGAGADAGAAVTTQAPGAAGGAQNAAAGAGSTPVVDQVVAAPSDGPGPPSTPSGDVTCDDTARPDPLPGPGSPRAQDFFRSFRTPLAPAPLYDPPGPRRVGLQAGHWLTDEVPPELGRLQGGSTGGGKQEWEVNLDIARRAAALLEAASIKVDVLPATVPPGYRANAFVALHADGDPAGAASGFKVARPGFSSLPDVDDRLVETLNQVYAADTELPRDDEHISLRMRYYYAFNSRRYCHAVAPGVPQAIIEMGYLTSPADRRLLIGNPDRLAHALADSLQAFLTTLP